MVFQTPNPLPMSIRKNVAFPLKLAGERDTGVIGRKLEQALRMANLWDEVKDRLDDDARALSGGQQQRLCIARALILEPEVLLLDEPTSSLDRRSTTIIEELLTGLKERLTILVVSHYLEQVVRISDRVVEFSDETIVSG
jgi:phosphate transport system ATP-binding protein